jgi:hypothetical protein
MNMVNRKVHIVIPNYNNYHLIHELLWNLYRKEKENISSILVVDDRSTSEEVKPGLDWWVNSKMLPLHWMTMNNTDGFLQTANEGLQTVAGLDETKPDDIIILLSTDVIVGAKFISQICDILNGNSGSLVGGVLYSHNTGWNTFGDRIFSYLEGWLLATTVQNWAKLDYFDERYSPNDFEDIDLSTTALSLGMELVPLNNVGIKHLGGKTLGYSPAREKITRINQEKFRSKWIGTNSKIN